MFPKKRKWMGGAGYVSIPTVESYPPLESTVLAETGGDNEGTTVGRTVFPLSSNVDRVQKLAYEEPFSSNDFYATNYANSVIGLCVSFYIEQGGAGSYSMAIVPLVLPPSLLCNPRAINPNPHQDVSNTGSNASKEFVKLQKSIAYAMNLQLSKEFIYAYAGVPASSTQITAGIATNSHFPLNNQNSLPPILWDVYPGTGQLYVKVNDAYDVAHYNTLYGLSATVFEVAFRFFNLDDGSLGNRSYADAGGGGDIIGEDSGWYGKGGTLFGFGKGDRTAQWNKGRYLDLYRQQNQPTTFYQSMFRAGTTTSSLLVATTYSKWKEEVVDLFQLTQTVQWADRTCACIANRYSVIRSNQLSKIQRRGMVSNTNMDIHSGIAVLYNIIDYAGVYNDGEQKQTVSNPVIHFNAITQSISDMDCSILSEYNHVMMPYTNDVYLHQNQFLILGDFIPSLDLIPTPYHALDPYNATNGPRYDCLFPYSRISAEIFRAPYILATERKVDVSQHWFARPGTRIEHFIRLIGNL
jgi:hypothetical protein